MAEGAGGPALRPARREARVTAFAVDMLVLAALGPGFVALGGLTVLLQTGWLEVDPTGQEWAWGYVVSGLWLLTPWPYFTLGTSRGGTVGARLLGLSVRDRRRRTLGPGRAAARAALLYPSALLLGLGFLVALLDGRGRTLADRLSDSRVFELGEGKRP